ncbi:hypothetical protein [Rubrivivax gelatinosus]|uniref:hypothetical protein n=1 Tax=Rubrivivax gelatinosus TaxID=28068 RepID=UPI000682D9F5|nr:hypothetical protein [Rubrivivax gelatinosus]MBG6083070.1 hypothetical protein [Rubrivivax gelatinosus]
MDFTHAHALTLRALQYVEVALAHLVGAMAPSDWAALCFVLLLSEAAARLGMVAYCLVALPGTAAHELAHYLVAWALRAHPALPSIVPERTSNGWRLGSVRFVAGPLRSVPIALAPMALAPLSLWWAGATLPRLDLGLSYALHAWGAATTFAASLPSRADWTIAAPALCLVGLALAFCWLG